MTRKPCLKDRDRADRSCEIYMPIYLLELNHSSLFNRYKFILALVDDYSTYAQVFLLKHKSETSQNFALGLQFLQSTFPGPGQFHFLLCNNGTEFISTSCTSVLVKYDVSLQLAEYFQHEHNATTERFLCTLQEIA